MTSANPQEPKSLPYYIADSTPLPSSIPSVPEVGATSAPLLSASYFIGARCNAYNEDFMLCKSQSKAGSQEDCLKEGRRVTRCAISVLDDINKHCADSFRSHWSCLENNNHTLSRCRGEEAMLNGCVAKFLNLTKVIPDHEGVQINVRQTPSRYLEKASQQYAS
ncbi:hypothetical protein V1512DRAFT_228134 [Lipomyces arxii]|uniref:uncharacterized protein n=1 Tax=Lipomyces arxii TaxID=56418 RepID=UPI0034CFEFD2